LFSLATVVKVSKCRVPAELCQPVVYSDPTQMNECLHCY